jgi:hypothetical protein
MRVPGDRLLSQVALPAAVRIAVAPTPGARAVGARSTRANGIRSRRGLTACRSESRTARAQQCTARTLAGADRAIVAHKGIPLAMRNPALAPATGLVGGLGGHTESHAHHQQGDRNEQHGMAGRPEAFLIGPQFQWLLMAPLATYNDPTLPCKALSSKRLNQA